MVCTLSLHVEGIWFKSWQVVHFDLEWKGDPTFRGESTLRLYSHFEC